MGIFICNGANLMCSFGMSPATLTVLPTSCVMVANQPMASIMDFAPMVNVATFGMCTSLANPTVASATSAALGVLTPMPCIPVTVAPWVPPNPTVLVGNMPSLLDDGKCMCTWGGNISIVFPGQVTVQTGASGAGSAKSLSGRSAGKTSGTSSSEDSKQQNKVLQKAAKEATPFCKEPQKKEETKEKAEKTNAEEKKEEKNEEKPQKEITRIFWIDEQSGEQKTLEELPPGYEVTLCVETKNIDDGENVEIEITDENGRNYKGGKQSLKFSSTVEADGTAYMENVKLEFDEK